MNNTYSRARTENRKEPPKLSLTMVELLGYSALIKAADVCMIYIAT